MPKLNCFMKDYLKKVAFPFTSDESLRDPGLIVIGRYGPTTDHRSSADHFAKDDLNARDPSLLNTFKYRSGKFSAVAILVI